MQHHRAAQVVLRLTSLMMSARIAAAVAGCALLAPAAVFAAADACMAVLEQAAGKDPVALAAEFEKQYGSDFSDVRPLWAAATLLRCSAVSMTDAALQCATAGRARALYVKFDDAATAKGAKPWKKELADAKKTIGVLTTTYATGCVQAAHAAKNANQHEQAANLFEATYQLTDKAVHLYNAARVCELGKLRNEAVVFYTAYLALPGPWLDRRDAVGKLVQLQRQLATDAGDLVRQAQQSADLARSSAQRAEQTAVLAQQQAKAADQRALSAETKAVQADQRAQKAETRASDAEQRAAGAEARAISADARARSAETAAADAQRRAAEANQRAGEAAAKASLAAQRAEAAEARVRQALENSAPAEPTAPRGR